MQNRADLRVFEPIHTVFGGESCFVRFYPGDDFTMRDFIAWMLENNIEAIDDDNNAELDSTKFITMEAKDRDLLWCWMNPRDAVLTRLRWADYIRK